MPRKTETDRIIAANEREIQRLDAEHAVAVRTLMAVNEALRELRDAKKRKAKVVGSESK